jgi:2'-hydroxyisoflavone reductase
LILGGTQFVGRHLVDAAQARGHELTLFNRGKTDANAYPEVEQLRGDRDNNVEALRGRRWDAAIDVAARIPRWVRASAGLLADSVQHYTFVSTLSVYADFHTPGMTENAPLGKLADETVEAVTNETYGPLKVLCERAAEQAMPGRVLTIRPGLIVGPYDNSDRFTYWPVRIARGGEVLTPAASDRIVAFIDARDMADWIIRMIEGNQTGIFNVTGPDYRLTLGQVFDTCRTVTGSHAHFTWVTDPFLLEQSVGPWMELPLWIPDTPEDKGFFLLDFSKALAAGLTFRPLAETVRDTLEWATEYPNPTPRAGLAPAKEAALLQKWRALNGN